MKKKVVVIVGPTASGKTGLAIDVAKEFDGEVISADSRQVYRGLDIGTAKVTEAEKDGVPHHLIDVVDIDQVYTAANFTRDAAAVIDKINHCGRLPVIAGGTFFYVDTLLGRITTPTVPPNQALRAELIQLSAAELYEKLQAADPDRAATIDPHNSRRLIRALEVWHTLGHVPKPTPTDRPYDTLIIGIETKKEILRERFRTRAVDWLQHGFQQEVEGLVQAGVSRERLHEIGFEYTLMLSRLDEEITEDEFVQKFIEKNWQYAKRQLTWLKRDETIAWYPLEDRSAILARVRKFLNPTT